MHAFRFDPVTLPAEAPAFRKEIREFLEADSLAYLSLKGLREAVGDTRNTYCTSCYTGVYPVSFPQNEEAYLQLALKAVD